MRRPVACGGGNAWQSVLRLSRNSTRAATCPEKNRKRPNYDPQNDVGRDSEPTGAGRNWQDDGRKGNSKKDRSGCKRGHLGMISDGQPESDALGKAPADENRLGRDNRR